MSEENENTVDGDEPVLDALGEESGEEHLEPPLEEPGDLIGEEFPDPAEAEREEPSEGEAEPGPASEAAPEAVSGELEDSGSLLHAVVEALLFTSQKPVSVKEIQTVLKGSAAAQPESAEPASLAKAKEPAIREAVSRLNDAYLASGRSFEIKESAAGWQLVTRPAFAPWLRQLFPENRTQRISAPAMETLAIIAYRQPLTRADIEAVRGVAVDGVMQTLLDRGLVKIAGRAEVPGRPLLYQTTQFFLDHFGLKDLSELPNAGELRNLPLPTATPSAAESGDRESAAESTPSAAAATEEQAVTDLEATTEPGEPAGSEDESPALDAPDEPAPDPAEESNDQDTTTK